MTLSFTKRFFPTREDQVRGCTLIDKIAALAQSSTDLNIALRCAADEIGRTLGLERAAILLRHQGGMRLAGDYCASGIGPVQREKLRQLDIDITRELGTQVPIIEIADARSDPRVSRRLAPAANRAEESAIRSILIVPLVIDSETAGTVLLYQGGKRRFSAQKHLAQAAASTLSLTIHHFRSQERARAAADREALTNRLLTAIRSTVGVDEILKVAVDGIGVTLKVTRVVIYKHGGSDSNRDSCFTARAEYRSSVLVPSLLNTELDLEGSPLLAKLLSGHVIEVPDTNQSDPIVRAMSVRSACARWRLLRSATTDIPQPR